MRFSVLSATVLLASSTAVTASSFFTSNTVPQQPLEDKFSVPGENPLVHCADPKDDILNLMSVDLSPNPPKAGEPLTITAKGKLSEDVEDGAKVLLTVKYGLITIIRQTADLCENVGQVDLECPLKKDNVTSLAKDVELPKQIPPGKYSVIADVLTKDDAKITCLTATVEFHIGGGMQFFGQDL